VRPVGTEGHLRLIGELDMATVDRLLDAIDPAISHNGDVTLELDRLTFLDSAGVDAFIEAGRRAAAHGRRLVLSSPSRVALKVLEILGADRFAGIRIVPGLTGVRSRAIVIRI